MSGIPTCFDFDDSTAADFFAILFHEEEILIRMMLLPKKIVSDLLALGESDFGNKKSCFVVYPSTMHVEDKLARVKQQITNAFEIDLSQPLLLNRQLEKAARILQNSNA